MQIVFKEYSIELLHEHRKSQINSHILVSISKSSLRYSETCLIGHALGEEFCVRIDRVLDYIV